MPSQSTKHTSAPTIEDEKTPEHREGSLPDNWPDDVEFIVDLTYSDKVTQDQRGGLCRTTGDSATWPRLAADLVTPICPRVKVTTIKNDKHPACGQRGLFAADHLIPDAFIIAYRGHVHTNSMSDCDPHTDYDLSLDRDLGLSVDAARSGNESRFANDYRGIAERPNAEFRDCFIQVPCPKRAEGVRWERRVGIFVLSAGKAGLRKKGIKAGEEIVVSYGKGYWEGRKTVASFRKDHDMLRIAQLALDA
ncbi:hypothetical protein B0A50_02647 [Salinomyces thailandicus]|uniref:SET domain-containing protein n=1 Tax=Salinomyces thailandicus TaxID=706561 RepID=A0A4U0U5J0_9PEZI|nr:hypothetical protein B0A50_02647 [Salinomyces thailandica]